MAEKSASKQKSAIKAKTSGVQDESTQPEAGPSRLSRDEDSKLNEDASSQHSEKEEEEEEQDHEGVGGEHDEEEGEEEGHSDNESTAEGFVKGMDPGGFIGDKSLKPLTPEGLAAFKAAQDRAGVIYISRIPPGMRPAKVRHLMSAYGAVGRVYLQQEDAKRAYLRKKFTSTKKVHYTEGWVEFKDKKVARSVAEMLNAQPIGGKKGTRWRDDIWTMKYLPRFKWYMLTEQVAYEAAVHTAKLRVELSQSKTEQQEYLKNVELARVLDKRAAKKKENGEEFEFKPNPQPKKRNREGEEGSPRKKKREEKPKEKVSLDSVLTNIF